MDDLDISILRLLRKDARMTLKEVSGCVNLSLPAVSERLRKLERSGVITGYTVLLDKEKLNQNVCCFCLLVMASHNSYKNETFLNFVQSRPEILECHCITGSHEYLLKIAASSTKDLEHLLIDLRDQWGVVKSSTLIVLTTIKEEPSISPFIQV